MQDTLTTGESQVHAAAAAGRLQELQTLTDDDSALRTVEMTEPGTACVVVSGCDGRGKSCNDPEPDAQRSLQSDSVSPRSGRAETHQGLDLKS